MIRKRRKTMNDKKNNINESGTLISHNITEMEGIEIWASNRKSIEKTMEAEI